MDERLIDLLLAGAELRVPEFEAPAPVDFIVVADASTLIVRADWWLRSWASGDDVQAINATPVLVDTDIWSFEHGSGALLAPPSDEDQATYLTHARTRCDLERPRYLSQLQLLVDAHPEFDFNPWIRAILDRPLVDLIALAQEETRERSIGKILLRNSSDAVVDALVIDELGHVASLVPDGYLALFAEQWANYAEGERPPLGEFVGWLATQQPYGGRRLADPGVLSASGDVQDIAFDLVSR